MRIKNLLNFLLVKSNDNDKDREKEEVVNEIKETIIEMEVAESMFNTVNDPKLIEVAIYKNEAAKRKFDYLMCIAKQQYINEKYSKDKNQNETVAKDENETVKIEI